MTNNPNSIPLTELEGLAGSAKFENYGDTHSGRITSATQAQQTDLDQKPMVWPNGQPRMQWLITVERADGETVTFYAKGGTFTAAQGKGDSMLAAISAAVRAAGASSLDVGAELAVSYTGTGKAAAGKFPPKLYSAEYKPAAAASIPVESLFER
jgi:hypothetical protein